MPDELSLNELHDYLRQSGTKFAETQSIEDHDWIERFLAKEIYIYAFNVAESDRVFAQTDPEVERTIQAMPKASTLAQGAKKVIVQRMSGQPQVVGAH